MRRLLLGWLVLALAGCASMPAALQRNSAGLDCARITPFPDSVVHALRVDVQTFKASVSTQS